MNNHYDLEHWDIYAWIVTRCAERHITLKMIVQQKIFGHKIKAKLAPFTVVVDVFVKWFESNDSYTVRKCRVYAPLVQMLTLYVQPDWYSP